MTLQELKAPFMLLTMVKEWHLGSWTTGLFIDSLSLTEKKENESSESWCNLGPISSIKFIRYILNCAYVVFWEVRTSVSSKHLKLFVRTKICVSLKTSYFKLCLTSVSKYHVNGHVRTWYSRVKWFNNEWKIRRYVKKVLKKLVRIQMKAGVRTSIPLENQKSYWFR